MEFFLCVLGMVMIIEGLPYFAFPEQMKSWVGKIREMSAGAESVWGSVCSACCFLPPGNRR